MLNRPFLYSEFPLLQQLFEIYSRTTFVSHRLTNTWTVFQTEIYAINVAAKKIIQISFFRQLRHWFPIKMSLWLQTFTGPEPSGGVDVGCRNVQQADRLWTVLIHVMRFVKIIDCFYQKQNVKSETNGLFKYRAF